MQVTSLIRMYKIRNYLLCPIGWYVWCYFFQQEITRVPGNVVTDSIINDNWKLYACAVIIVTLILINYEISH